MTNQMIRSVFRSQHLHLGRVNPEGDATIEATWMTDPGYAEDRIPPPARPLSEHELLKKLQSEVKAAEGSGSEILFALRANLDDHLVGFIHIHSILWNQRSSRMKILYGGKANMERFGTEIIRLSLDYIFHEMNLNRVALTYPEYRQAEIDLLKSEGFIEEVRRRSAHYYHGKFWDVVHLGIIRRDWHDREGEVDHGNL